MDVYEAVTGRRAVRGFTDEPVSREVLERVLSAAAWSPSGSNLQPWNSYVLTGALLAELKTRAVERVAHGDPWDEREYEMYPRALKSPYGERRSAFGKERYSALGIAREDWEARQRGTVSARPPPCSATSTATWAGLNGPTGRWARWKRRSSGSSAARTLTTRRRRSRSARCSRPMTSARLSRPSSGNGRSDCAHNLEIALPPEVKWAARLREKDAWPTARSRNGSMRRSIIDDLLTLRKTTPQP